MFSRVGRRCYKELLRKSIAQAECRASTERGINKKITKLEVLKKYRFHGFELNACAAIHTIAGISSVGCITSSLHH